MQELIYIIFFWHVKSLHMKSRECGCGHYVVAHMPSCVSYLFRSLFWVGKDIWNGLPMM